MPRATANYLSVDPVTGAVSATFPGGVTIEGLTPPPVSFPTPALKNAITWTRGPGGAAVAQVVGGYTASSNSLFLNAQSPDASASAVMQAAASNGGVASINVGAGNTLYTIASSNNRTAFTKGAGSPTGVVLSNSDLRLGGLGYTPTGGTITPQQIPLGGVTVTYGGVGDYTINFPYAASRIATFTLIQPAQIGIPLIAATTASSIRLFVESTALALFDASWWCTYIESV